MGTRTPTDDRRYLDTPFDAADLPFQPFVILGGPGYPCDGRESSYNGLGSRLAVGAEVVGVLQTLQTDGVDSRARAVSLKPKKMAPNC